MNSVNVGDVSVYLDGELIGKLVMPAAELTAATCGGELDAGDDDRDWGECGCDVCNDSGAAADVSANDSPDSPERILDEMLASDAPAVLKAGIARLDGLPPIARGSSMVAVDYGYLAHVASAAETVLEQREAMAEGMRTSTRACGALLDGLRRLSIQHVELGAEFDTVSNELADVTAERDELRAALAAARVIRGQQADELARLADFNASLAGSFWDLTNENGELRAELAGFNLYPDPETRAPITIRMAGGRVSIDVDGSIDIDGNAVELDLTGSAYVTGAINGAIDARELA